MSKVFLSHSSLDKKDYVKKVAESLIKEIGIHNVVYDELTFEKGMMPLEEIDRELGKTDLFVIFLSNNSLESEWVKYELKEAEKLKNMDIIDRIFPIIIDEKISYSDERIPRFLKDNYNIKPIMKYTKAFKMIKQRLLEINWDKYPRIKEREDIFVGRNTYIQEFEERFYSWDDENINIVIAYGLKNSGRKSLIKKCLRTVDVIKSQSYEMSSITINGLESLEDFILKIYDLGFSEEVEITSLMSMELDKKVDIAINLINGIQENNEILHIEDEGGIVTHDGSIATWFLEITKKLLYKDRLSFAVTSKFRVSTPNLWKYPNIYTIEVKEFEKREIVGLFTRYLDYEGINLDREVFKRILTLLKGYPEQVTYAVYLLKREGIKWTLNNLDQIVDFNRQKVLNIIKELGEDKELEEFLVFLCSFEYIGYDFIFEVVGDTEKYKGYLIELLNRSICQYIGTNKEYLKVNESIKDHVLRNNMKLKKAFEDKMKELVGIKINNMEGNNYDIPELLFTIKEALKNGGVLDPKYLIPSHYLTLMHELYNKDKNYKDVVKFADKALENEEFMDDNIVFEIRYMLCLSLAKLRNTRFTKEVQKIEGADHSFLMAYYYRLTNRYDKALEKLIDSLKQRKNFSKANRELVQVYINLQEYDKAKEQAKKNFDNDINNPYHIQAYFTCLIRSEKSEENRKILTELIDLMSKVNSDIAKEMLLRLKAQYEAFYNDNEEVALALIEQAIDEYPKLQYALLIKFDICDKFNRIEEMESIIVKLKNISNNQSYMNNIVYYEAVILAKKGKLEEAMLHVEKNLKNYTDEAIERVKIKLEKYKVIKGL